MTINRRQLLAHLGLPALGLSAWPRAGWTAAPSGARASTSTRLVAAWRTKTVAQVGVLRAVGSSLNVVAALDVPTRPHGLAVEPSGTLLAVARRPGDWLLRWDASGRAITWAWAEPERVFNGHVLCDAMGETVYTTETDLATGAGWVGVRDARTLAKRDEWPTQGRDPHALLWDAQAAPGTRLIVANGGLETRPETGRLKLNRAQMDSSIVRIDARTGALQGQWRLADARLSLRHLAWHGQGPQAVLGVSMQAEHDDAAQAAQAPVLALFDGQRLRVAAMQRPLAGYGGDIAATADGFVVGCPRAQGVAKWTLSLDAAPDFMPLPDACAMAQGTRGEATVWMAGHPRTAAMRDGQPAVLRVLDESLQLDNHWVAMAGA